MSTFLTSYSLSKASNFAQSLIVDNNCYYDTIGATTTPVVLGSAICGSYPYIEISIKSSVALAISVQQSNRLIVDDDDVISAQSIIVDSNADPTTAPDVYYTHIGFPQFRIVMQNNSDPLIEGTINITTKLVATRPSNAITHLDSVNIAGKNASGGSSIININGNGELKSQAKMVGTTPGGVEVPIACDTDGNLAINVQVEGITLTPATDGISVYGSSDGTDRLLLATTSAGILKTDTNVTIENIELTPAHDGVSVYGSSDGTDRLLLATTPAGILKTDTNVTIENIQLTPAHDGVSVYGSSNGSNRLLLATTDAGILKTDTNVTIENIKLTPDHDGVTMYGKTDLGLFAPIKTDFLGVVSVTDPDAHIQLAELNTTLNKINVNMNSNTNLKVSASNISSSAGGSISPVVDLGTAENRDRNIVFFGEADVAIPANANPKLIMKFSEDLQGDYFSDGEYASFYKKDALNRWEFCFQRSNCPLRYVQLYTETDAKLITLKCVTSKN